MKNQLRQVFNISEERADDWWEVEALFDLCFAPGREALSSYRLRDDVSPIEALSRVARDHTGIMAGAIRFWPVSVAGHATLLLGPIAVHPTHQGEGLGAYLIRDGVDASRTLGWTRVMLVGDASYYARFGFERLAGIAMPPPTNPERVLGLALRPEAWVGVTGDVQRWNTDH